MCAALLSSYLLDIAHFHLLPPPSAPPRRLQRREARRVRRRERERERREKLAERKVRREKEERREKSLNRIFWREQQVLFFNFLYCFN